jgi:transcriptional regulator with XRE-family HTH domain
MNGSELKQARKKLAWTQVEAAKKLQVSQGYLSMLESGVRPVPRKLQQRFVKALQLSPLAVPTRDPRSEGVTEDELAGELGALGYPGFGHVRSATVRWNPADLLLAALSKPALDSRLSEALPWLAFRFADLDWQRVVRYAKVNDLQNRLGFVVTLARQLADRENDSAASRKLRQVEESLRNSVLLRADALARLTKAERRWLETERPPEAKAWNVLSDLSVHHLAREF